LLRLSRRSLIDSQLPAALPQYLCATIAAPLRRSLIGGQLCCSRLAAELRVCGYRPHLIATFV